MTISPRRFFFFLKEEEEKLFEQHLFQGMGTLFREGTRFMTDLNVIHVIESICSGTEIIHKNSLTGPKLAQNSIFCSFFFKTPLLKKTPRLLNSSISMNTIIPLSTQPIIK